MYCTFNKFQLINLNHFHKTLQHFTQLVRRQYLTIQLKLIHVVLTNAVEIISLYFSSFRSKLVYSRPLAQGRTKASTGQHFQTRGLLDRCEFPFLPVSKAEPRAKRVILDSLTDIFQAYFQSSTGMLLLLLFCGCLTIIINETSITEMIIFL